MSGLEEKSVKSFNLFASSFVAIIKNINWKSNLLFLSFEWPVF